MAKRSADRGSERFVAIDARDIAVSGIDSALGTADPRDPGPTLGLYGASSFLAIHRHSCSYLSDTRGDGVDDGCGGHDVDTDRSFPRTFAAHA